MSKELGRSKKTLYNALTQSAYLLVATVMQLIAVRTVLLYLGSDYNGINGTISSFLSVLMLLESGFTLATLVLLYKPYSDSDYETLNKILSKTSKIFKRIGLWMLFGGTSVAALYCLTIRTGIEYIILLALFEFSIINISFNFVFVYKYNLLYQVSQTEYILHLFNIVNSFVSNIGLILIVSRTRNILLARGYYSLCSILLGCLVIAYTKKKFPQVSYSVRHDDVKIEGTSNLLISKIASMLYGNITVFYLASFVGTMMTSVYTVFNSVILVVTNFTTVFLSAPRNSLGQIIHTDKDRVAAILREFEFLVVFIMCVLFTVTMIFIMPFVRLYTMGVTDADYYQPVIGVLLVLISVTQIIHIPSGICIELAGRFKVVRNIQLITMGLILVFSTIGGICWELIGLLLAKLLTNVVLASIEIIYTHKKVANLSLRKFVKDALPNIILGILLSFVGYYLMRDVAMNWVGLIGCAVVVTLVVLILFVLLNYAISPNQVTMLVKRVRVSVMK